VNLMFTIELLLGRDRDPPEVVDRTTSPRYFLYDVEHRAKTLLTDAKRQFPANPPDGYRILDKDGAVVAQFWRGSAGPPRDGA
jgi:hypothetical protein